MSANVNGNPVGMSVPPGTPSSESRLSGRLKTGSLTMAVLALSAPICVAAGFIPLVISSAGEAAPLAFLVTAAVMLLFSVGYIAMARRIPKPGAFYTFITAGLAKPTGLGSAYLAMVSYGLISVGSFVFFGLQGQILMQSFGGPDIPWVIYALICWVGTVALGHFNIELSAKVLGAAMVLEVIVVMIFNLAVLFQGGESGLPARPYSPFALAQGDVPVALVFAILVFIGFEATALYRDETHNPDKTIPRATYVAVLFIGVLYSVTAYALIAAYGDRSVALSAEAPASMFSTAIGVWVLPVFTQIVLGMVLISQFAALLSFHNVLSRYAHSLSADRALPQYFAAVHPKHHSPYKSSALVGVCIGVSIVALSLTQVPGEVLYAQMTGLGAFGVMLLMALVSVAVLSFFRKRGWGGENLWKTAIAPAAASLVLCALIIFALSQFQIIVGGEPGENIWMPMALVGVVVLGALFALYYRAKRPSTYARLGRSALEVAEPLEVAIPAEKRTLTS